MKELASTVLEFIIIMAIKCGFLYLIMLILNKACDLGLDWRFLVIIISLDFLNGLFPFQVKLQKDDD